METRDRYRDYIRVYIYCSLDGDYVVSTPVLHQTP